MWFLDVLVSLPMLVAMLAIVGFVGAQARVIAASGGDVRTLAALPKAHGTNAALSVLVPAFASLIVLSLVRLISNQQGVDILTPRVSFWLVVGIAVLGLLAALVRCSAFACFVESDYRQTVGVETRLPRSTSLHNSPPTLL